MAAIAEAVEKDRREKQKANAVNQHQEALGKKLPQPSAIKDEQKTATKAAEMFNTNLAPGDHSRMMHRCCAFSFSCC
jgi:RNase H-fold protein (predicted Holliday junction resolvase)